MTHAHMWDNVLNILDLYFINSNYIFKINLSIEGFWEVKKNRFVLSL